MDMVLTEGFSDLSFAFFRATKKYISNKDFRINVKVRRIGKSQGFAARYKSKRLFDKYALVFAPTCKIGSNLSLPHPMGIVVGWGVTIGDNCTIYQHVTLGQNHGNFPVIGSGVVIYAGACIIGDITIGDNAIIGANSVVTHDVPSNSIVGGVPAKTIKTRDVSAEDLF